MPLRTLTTKRLPNGLRVAVIPDPHSATVTALVLVRTGSSFETKKTGGISHFLEHVCFKGTAKRPSAKIISEEIESLGAVTNAFTDRDITGYWIKGSPTHAAIYTDILADIYQHSTFPKAEIDKERGVVIEEINMYEDMPQQKVGELLFSMLYPNQPAGFSVLGTKETLARIGVRELMAYRDAQYTAANTVVVLSGNITLGTATSLVKKHFGTLKKGKKNQKKKINDTQREVAVSMFKKPLDQAHMIIGFRSLALQDKDVAVARLLSTILGRGTSSRLYQLIREELGAAYYVYAGQESYPGHGIFSISAGLDKSRFALVLSKIVEECKRIKETSVEDIELARAKEFTTGMMRLSLELSDDIATFFGVQVVLDQKVKSLEKAIEEIKAVTARDIQRVARRIFTPKGANLALVGPFASDAQFKEILRTL